MTTPGPALSVDGLGVRYGAFEALRDVSFTLAPGELVAVVGPNGAGKSSMLRAVAGLVPHAGRIAIGGAECHHRLDRLSVAYIPQRHDLDFDFPITVGQLVHAGRRRYGRRRGKGARAAHRIAVGHALDRVGLAGFERRSFGSLSGGQAQRALLARALAQEARLILLDEALSGVDQPSADALLDLFGELRDLGCTLLVATHDLALARRRFDRCLAINRRLVADGRPNAVLAGATLDATFGSGTLAA